jgi:hypothetical protein
MGGLVGDIGGAIISSNASKKASKQQQQSADAAINEQRRQFDISQQNQQPFLQFGTGAVNKLGDLLGIQTQTFDEERYLREHPEVAASAYWSQSPEEHYNRFYKGKVEDPYKYSEKSSGFGSLLKPFSMSDFQADPGYSFNLAEGQKALDRSFASRGGLLSGAALKAGMQYGTNLANQTYQDSYNRFNNDQSNQFNRLASLAGVGQTSANTLGTLGANMASNVGELLTQQGNAKAAGTIGSANAWLTGLNNFNNRMNGGIGGIQWY